MEALAETFSAMTNAVANKAKAQAFEQLENPANQDAAVKVILSAPIPHEEKRRIAAALRTIADKVIAAEPAVPVGGTRRRRRRRHLTRKH